MKKILPGHVYKTVPGLGEGGGGFEGGVLLVVQEPSLRPLCSFYSDNFLGFFCFQAEPCT